jgi:hypothetical protein
MPNPPNRQTLSNYLHSPAFLGDLEDPEIQRWINYYEKAQADDLRLIIMKCRQRQHEFLDDPASARQPIPVTAIADRSFQQLTAIEGRQPVPDVQLAVSLLQERLRSNRLEQFALMTVQAEQSGRPFSEERQKRLMEAINRGEDIDDLKDKK